MILFVRAVTLCVRGACHLGVHQRAAQLYTARFACRIRSTCSLKPSEDLQTPFQSKMTARRAALRVSDISVSVLVVLIRVWDDFAVANFAPAAAPSAAAPSAAAPAAVDLEFAIVSTSDEFQEAMRQAVQHIVVVDHINMTQAPNLKDLGMKMNAGVAGIFEIDGRVTKSIRVRSFACDISLGSAIVSTLTHGVPATPRGGGLEPVTHLWHLHTDTTHAGQRTC